MDTDPNPFRDTPDSDRSASPTEAPDDETRDFTADDDTTSSGGSTPMSEESDDSSPSSKDIPSEAANGTQPAGSTADAP
jgi:hypothetical protein